MREYVGHLQEGKKNNNGRVPYGYIPQLHNHLHPEYPWITRDILNYNLKSVSGHSPNGNDNNMQAHHHMGHIDIQDVEDQACTCDPQLLSSSYDRPKVTIILETQKKENQHIEMTNKIAPKHHNEQKQSMVKNTIQREKCPP